MVKDSAGGLDGDCVGADRDGDRIRIAYVMGYGRSGSTLLDVMLGSDERVTSVGEVSYLSEWLSEDKRCGCHLRIRECGFWSSVMSAYRRILDGETEPIGEVEASVESRKSLLRLLGGRVPESLADEYRRTQTALFSAVSQVAGTPIIVDSSKSVHRTDGRCLALQKFTDFDVRAIHLVRDGRAVTWSALRGPGTMDIEGRNLPTLVRGIWTLAHWTVTNLICLVLARWMEPGSVMRVRYEDLVRDPLSELEKIGDFVGVDLTAVSEMISAEQPLSPGHNVGGNRLRFASAIRVKEDREWRDRLPWPYRALFWLIAWPVAGKLGYTIGRG